MERRKSHRIQRRAQCRILVAKKKHEGMILDLSEGGLAFVCKADLEPATPVRLEFAGLGRSVQVSAVVWHQRRVRFRGGESYGYGCIVEDPGPEYLDLLPDMTAKRDSAPPVEPASPERARLTRLRAELSDAIRESAASSDPRTYRVRVRQGNRTRTLTLAAADEDEARAAAQEALDDGWELLDVQEAQGRRSGS